jgi:4-hydroxy-tetrahydrodipicolinate synthase
MRHGIYVPLVTPFTEPGEVALDALEGLAHTVLDAGAVGVVALGTTGEPATLTADERRAVVDVCARVCRERSAALIVGAGSNDTAASIEALAALRRRPEIHAALTVVPYYIRPSEDGVVAHFARLAATSPVPLVVYHVPYRTGRPLGATTLLRLADLPNVAGIKYAAGTVDADTVAFMAGVAPDFAVLAGDDLFVVPMLALGAAGGVLASAHVCTDAFVELFNFRGRPIGHRLAMLSAALFAEPNPAVVKGVLHAWGRIPSPAVRLPLLPASEGAVDAALRLAESLRAEVA